VIVIETVVTVMALELTFALSVLMPRIVLVVVARKDVQLNVQARRGAASYITSSKNNTLTNLYKYRVHEIRKRPIACRTWSGISPPAEYE
jgi:hypothetical protein